MMYILLFNKLHEQVLLMIHNHKRYSNKYSLGIMIYMTQCINKKNNILVITIKEYK